MILLYLRTLRSLKLRQWVYFPLRRLQANRPLRLSPAAPAEARFALPEAPVAAAVAAFGPRHPDVTARGEAVMHDDFEFLGRRADRRALDWTGEHISRLWTYNLHYFDYALDLAWTCRETGNGRYANAFTNLALEWIEATRGERGPGWEPYTTSVRIVNWTQALLLLGERIRPEYRAAIAGSLHHQLRWLERRIEWHILANHLQRNLQALTVGGAVFTGADAARWRERYAPMLWTQLLEQVLPDGGHYERSPMYHATALGDFLETIAICDASGIAVPDAARERVTAMVGALDPLARPDGSLHLFNDAAHGIAPPTAWLRRLAASLRLAPKQPPADELPRTGYYLFTGDGGTRCIVDCGDPGPAYQPGHAHCDLLSFELDLAGRRVVVDSGVHGYDGDPYREYVRSTRAHNTVMIGGKEQHEMWGTFRVARRARVLDASVEGTAPWTFRGAYQPYHSRRTRHERRLVCHADGAEVTDVVRGAAGVSLDSYLHLHPDFTVSLEGEAAVATARGLTVRIEPFGVDRVSVHRGETAPTQGWYCPEFGTALPAPAVRFHVAANRGEPFGYRITRIA